MITATSVAKRLAVAGVVTLSAQLVAAVLWPVRRQPEHDPSAWVGPSQGQPLRVAALGDSTCCAPGVDGPGDIWIRVVADRIVAKTGRPVDLKSFAAGGARALDVVAAQLEPALAFQPDIAFVSVGANDVIRGVPMDRFAADLDRIVSRLTATGALVITSGVGDLGTIPRLAPPLRHLVSRLGRRADRIHTVVSDRYGAVKSQQWDWASEQFRTRRDVWSSDRFHPNAAGHLVWAETAWRSLEPHLATFVTGVRAEG